MAHEGAVEHDKHSEEAESDLGFFTPLPVAFTAKLVAQAEINDHYDVEIQRMSDGVTRWYRVAFPWDEGSYFWWVEGNNSCDCNRGMDFDRAGGDEPFTDYDCGDTAYRVRCARLFDGSVQALDG